MSSQDTADRPSQPVSRWSGRLLALTGLGLAVLGILTVAELTEGVLESGDLAALDPAVTDAVVQERTPTLTALAWFATQVGSITSVSILTLVLVGWLLWRRRWWPAAVVSVAMGLSALLTVVLKEGIGRARPAADLVAGAVSSSYAFPSGHTLNSTVFFGLVAGLVAAGVGTVRARVVAVVAWVLASLSVGLSRIYLGYHWLTDVLAGWVLGVVVLGLTLAVVAWLRPPTPRPDA